MRNRNDELDMAHTLTAHFLLGYLHAATLADDTFITDPFVFAAMALVILGRTEYTLTEQTIAFGFVRTIVNRFRFEDLTRGELHDLIRGRESNRNLGETGFSIFLFKSHNRPPLFHVDTKSETL